jgi:RNA polymerase sigma factor (sigma-70 family)
VETAFVRESELSTRNLIAPDGLLPVIVSRHSYMVRNDQVAQSRRMMQSNGLEQIFMANRSALARYLRARLRGDGETEDILQDLWVKLATLETGPVAQPLAYLYRMAENMVLDRRRAAIRRSNREIEWTRGHIDGTIETSIDGEPSAERTLLARDHLNRVEAALNCLPERTAFAFRAARIDGTPQKEVAASMGISLSAVEKHLQKAYRAMLDVQRLFVADMDGPQRHSVEGAS